MFPLGEELECIGLWLDCNYWGAALGGSPSGSGSCEAVSSSRGKPRPLGATRPMNDVAGGRLHPVGNNVSFFKISKENNWEFHGT